MSLFGIQLEKCTFFIGGKSLEFSESWLHFFLDHWKKLISSISHWSFSDTIQSWKEGLSLNFWTLNWVIYSSQNSFNRSVGNFSQLTFKICLFELSDLIEHTNCSLVEMSLGIKLGVSEEVDQGSLLNEFVFFINSAILELFFCFSQVLVLNHLGRISPLVGELSVFISRVDIVEDWELWSDEVSEMSNLNITEIETNEELVMPDHSSQPVIMFPSSESWNSVNWSNIKTNENKASSWSSQSFVMWWHLFWTNSLEQSFHEVKIWHINWWSLRMIWMHISDLHLIKSVGVVIVWAIFSSIFRFDSI